MAERTRVRGFIRKGKAVNSYSRNRRKRKLLIGASATAIGVGGSVVALRARYIRNLAKSARKAEELSKTIKVADLTKAELDRGYINFAVSGLGAKQEFKDGSAFAKELTKQVKGKSVPINSSINLKSKNIGVRFFTEVHSLYTRNFLRGYNPDSIELAATVLAYQRKYPRHNLVMYGYSSGALATNEAGLILTKLPKVNTSNIKQVTLGGTNYGLMPSYKNSLHLVRGGDIQSGPVPYKNRVVIGSRVSLRTRLKQGSDFLRVNHKTSSYTRNEEVLDKIRKFSNNPNYKPTEEIKVVKPRATKLTELREEAIKSAKDYRKIRRNTNLPPDKRDNIIKAKYQAYLKAKRKYTNYKNSSSK